MAYQGSIGREGAQERKKDERVARLSLQRERERRERSIGPKKYNTTHEIILL